MENSPAQIDFHWRQIWLGLSFSLAVSLIIGLPVTLAFDNAWWFAWIGVASLFISAFIVARRTKTGEPLNGAMMALMYFGIFFLIYFAGQALEILPDPLPGLPADDSTYFFVWPLAQIIAGTMGSLLGGIGSRARAI